ncbi:MAG: UvrD-helicase domain-containing protein [Gemmatimonadota bacterium]|nr:MAG: UvrD-helicase domain-containing protein [Gemmatimonadota bacterium]
MVPRELVLASAGSGKTYHLSSRIIGLLAAGAPVDEVLASTFTRKAAGEILERVLTRLAEGASDSEKAQDLGRDAHASLARPEDCRALLSRLLAELHELNVGTLDAFFVRVARSFFQELGLAPGWTIADRPTQDRLKTEAVGTALAGADRAELVELLRMLNRDEADRQVHSTLLDIVDTLLRIRRRLAPEAVDPWSPSFGVTERLSPDALRAAALDAATRLRELEVPQTKAGSPMTAWAKARDSAAAAIAALDWSAAFGKGVGAKILGGDDVFSRAPIPSAFLDVFDEVSRLARIDLAPKLRRETEAMGLLAELLETAFESAQRRAGAYRFEDITYLLGGPDPTGGRDDLHYRLDQQVRHILLDEFQDTSLEQWRALKPLAHELLSGHLDERAGVIVADPKQSIYGWRGARPELARRVGERHGLAEHTMETSWRSSVVVLDFVADIFRGLPTNAVVSSIDVGPDVAAAWMEDFTELAPARDLPGHVCVHLAPADSGRAAIRPQLLGRAAEVVKGLHDQMPGRTIGVLVRRNTVAGYLMDALRALGVRASGEGGTLLTDTPPANAVLSLIRLADHPGDRAALYHVASTPLGEVVELRDRQDHGAARTVAARIRGRLLRDGYGPTLAGWVHDLAPRCDAREVQRLLQLVELGHRWDERPTLRPSDFTRYVAGESVEDPSSARVQVMTVHKSKGMEFDSVVLPELYVSLEPKGPGVAIPERDEDGLVVRVYPHIQKDLLPLFPEVLAAERERRAAGLRDGLSVLYVALTRAKYALHVIVPPEGGSTKHSAAVIREALELKDEQAGAEGMLFERGDPLWFKGLEAGAESLPEPLAEEKPQAEADPRAPLLAPSPHGPGRNLARRSPSSLEGGAHVDLSDTLRLDAAPALRRGEVVHAWCEELEWIEDWVLDDDALETIARETAPGMADDQVAALIADFHGWLEAEPIRGALTRAAFPSEPDTVVRVEKELPFARRLGDEIQEGFIDRLVLILSGGRVVRAEILDFKTDAIERGDEASLAARAEHYRPQITAYCDVVREQHGLAEGQVAGKLMFLRAGVVSDVV